ncbi:MAG: HAD-IIA family hydrolase [Lachnospiraceae bacterium]|nr:HAD-IIA family hydrolase [Lachnospiraceae bacterium]
MDLKKVKAVLFDLDGTIYYGSKRIDGANETIRFFRDNEIRVYFTTNNSTKTRKQIYNNLKGMGIDCKLDEILNSGYLAALTAKKYELEDIYIFGSPNLLEEFKSQGIKVCQEENAQNLLIGYDPAMTYDGLAVALRVALHARCIIACNRERVFPGEDAKLMPGCGAMTAPIEWCANRECDYVIGKPNTLMIDVLTEMTGISRKGFLVIGDTYESDIVMANVAGAMAVLISDTPRRDVPTVASIADIPKLF